MKPSVYIETTIVGHLTSRFPTDIVVVAQMLETRRWWDVCLSDYDLFISEVVEQEVSQGDPTAVTERQAAIAGIAHLPILDSSRQLARNLLVKHGLPTKAKVDALHLAICATNSVNYLLTWNCRHLANATQRKTIAEICAAAGYNAPEICTPPQMMKVRP